MKKWTLILAGLVLWGCTSTPKVEKLPVTADVNDEMRRLDQEVTDARTNNQTDILSPDSWKQATYYADEAKQRVADNREKEKILYSIAKARAWLQKANDHAEQASIVIPDLLQVRKEAIEAQAPLYASDEFKAADKAMREYTADREDSEFGIDNARRGTFREAYINSQIKAQQNHYLGEARQTIQHARDKDARTLVPNVWDEALRSYKNAQGFIAANRLNETGIESVTTKATVDAKKLERLTLQAIAVSNATPEQRALVIDRMKQRSSELNDVLDQQAFDQKFDEARQMFDKEDAEVYKQGSHLLLRMKGIEFPVGSASLPPSSYPLISKVGNVIKTFGGNPQVRIEGHTDPSGGRAVNERLSQQRGEAVKSYLVSSIGLQPEQIEVVAVSDTRPIASNKTAEGRAQNRRVDVIVMPQMQEPQIKQAQ
jgi:OmpA-OmpF porin, OOP family